MPRNTVLIVEDSDVEWFLTDHFLDESDITLKRARTRTGREALDWIEAHGEHPRLILLDLQMPVMDGFQFLERYDELEFTGPPAAVVVTTSSDLARDRERALSFRAVREYVIKPLMLTAADVRDRIVRLVYPDSTDGGLGE